MERASEAHENIRWGLMNLGFAALLNVYTFGQGNYSDVARMGGSEVYSLMKRAQV